MAVAKRELIPLTTGLISDVKRKRTAKMRHMIRLKKKSVVKIQVGTYCTSHQCTWASFSFFHSIAGIVAESDRALLHVSGAYPHDKFLHWTVRYDLTLSEEPFYFNLATEERLPWKKKPIDRVPSPATFCVVDL